MAENKTAFDKFEYKTLPLAHLFNWQWPEHIEQMIRRLLWCCLNEIANCEVDGLAEISSSDCYLARLCWLIVVNPDSPPELLDWLAETLESEAYLERIAENPNTQAETLSKLAYSFSANVKIAVLDNRNAPPEVIYMLASDENADVRYAIAENHNCDRDVLNLLHDDENCYVAARATQTLRRTKSGEPFKLKAKDHGYRIAAGQVDSLLFG